MVSFTARYPALVPISQEICSSGILCSVDWYLVTDVSGQPIGSVFLDYLTLEDGTDMLSSNVGDYWSTLFNILEE